MEYAPQPHEIPAELTCDVCTAVKPGLWVYPTAEWTVEVMPAKVAVFLAGHFAVCDACHALAEAGDVGSLALRGAWGNAVVKDPAGFLLVLRETYTKFLAARLGPGVYRTSREEMVNADS